MWRVDRPAATANRHGPTGGIKRQSGRYVYEDELVSSEFFVTSRVNFSVTNNMDHPIRIIWTGAKFIYFDNQTGDVRYSLIKDVDRNKSRPARTVRGGETLLGDTTLARAFLAGEQENGDKRFGLLLPLECDGVVNEYTFRFEPKEATGSRDEDKLVAAREQVIQGPGRQP